MNPLPETGMHRKCICVFNCSALFKAKKWSLLLSCFFHFRPIYALFSRPISDIAAMIQLHVNTQRIINTLFLYIKFYKHISWYKFSNFSNYLFALFCIYKQLEEHIINTVTKKHSDGSSDRLMLEIRLYMSNYHYRA